MKLFMVDDEENIVKLVKFNAELQNYEVDFSHNGNEALETLRENKYDLIILDVMLPDINGLKILKEIKKDSKNINTPVIMLTAKSEEVDIVQGLELGADDYLTKPFGVHELMARIKKLLRIYHKEVEEVTKPKKSIIKFDNVRINLDSRTVKVNGEEISLTKKEYNLLIFFYDNVNVSITRETLLDKIWGYDYVGESRTVDTHIKNLRNKIEKGSNKKYIKTIIGVGYMFKFGEDDE